MAIKGFVFVLLLFSIISYLIPVKEVSKKNTTLDIPILTFSDSTMYTLTPTSMNRVIYAEEVLRFESKDVMHKGVLTLKGKDKELNEITDVLYSDVIIKKENNFTFLNNVKYKRNNYITLDTDELMYNSKTKVATNTLPFEGTYFNNYIKGKDIYLDLNKYYMKAKDAHFEIEVVKGKK